jgi:predicted GNAT superfamily acetyltransferase
VALQEETWGEGFSERVPTAILKVAAALGGVAAGAYDADERLVGFVFGMTGIRDGELVHWSDMLAVRPEVRDLGLGALLKRYQREQVVALGVEKMFWTFDPLRARNAYLNFAKLGVVVREYVPDMYGETDSPLHSGVGTDRLVALWMLTSERVRTRLGHHSPALDHELTGEARRALGPVPAVSDRHASPCPGAPILDLDAPRVLISVPTDVDPIMRADMAAARAWRAASRAAFQHYLARGYEATEFVRGPVTSDYVLSRVEAMGKDSATTDRGAADRQPDTRAGSEAHAEHGRPPQAAAATTRVVR